jgi:glucan phosphoethanolaminetransferase (alkaline phosphatase superfamily)
MTRATRENMAPATSETSFISLFRKTGFYTLWVSEQGKYGLGAQRTQISSISGESEVEVFNDKNFSFAASRRNLDSPDSSLYVNELEAYFQSQTRSSSRKMLAVFHMAGSHFPYHWRYTPPFRKYAPTCPDVLPQLCPRGALINSYDNSILYTDFFIAGVIDTLRDKNAILFYLSDHGEYLGEHGRFLHGQETSDAELRHVPMFVWTSDTFSRLYPGKVRHMREKQALGLRQEFLFHSILDCSDIESPVINQKSSVCAPWDE